MLFRSVTDLAGSKGRPARLVVVHPLPEDWDVLPAPEYVEKEMRGEMQGYIRQIAREAEVERVVAQPANNARAESSVSAADADSIEVAEAYRSDASTEIASAIADPLATRREKRPRRDLEVRTESTGLIGLRTLCAPDLREASRARLVVARARHRSCLGSLIGSLFHQCWAPEPPASELRAPNQSALTRQRSLVRESTHAATAPLRLVTPQK